MSSVRSCFISFLLLLFLAACAPQPTPAPTPHTAYVGTTPAYADWLEKRVTTYWQDQPSNGVIPLIYPLEAALEAVEQDELELLVSAAQPPEGWFATPLLLDGIAILVHPDVPIRDLNMPQLSDIFLGRMENWTSLEGEDRKIQPIIPLPGDETRTSFQDEVLNGARYTSNALLAPNPMAALEMVASKPGSITFLPWTAIPTDRTTLRVEGVQLTARNIETGRYPLTLQLLAFAPEEPRGTMREFLGWLQATLLSESQ
jgi:hypothetical protein